MPAIRMALSMSLLASHGRSRHVALTVPNFMFALAVISDSDLVSACQGASSPCMARDLAWSEFEAPVPVTTFRLHAVAPKVAMMDMGLRWLFDLLVGAENAP